MAHIPYDSLIHLIGFEASGSSGLPGSWLSFVVMTRQNKEGLATLLKTNRVVVCGCLWWLVAHGGCLWLVVPLCVYW